MISPFFSEGATVVLVTDGHRPLRLEQYAGFEPVLSRRRRDVLTITPILHMFWFIGLLVLQTLSVLSDINQIRSGFLLQFRICSLYARFSASLYLSNHYTACTFALSLGSATPLRAINILLRPICAIFKYQEGRPIGRGTWIRTKIDGFGDHEPSH